MSDARSNVTKQFQAIDFPFVQAKVKVGSHEVSIAGAQDFRLAAGQGQPDISNSSIWVTQNQREPGLLRFCNI